MVQFIDGLRVKASTIGGVGLWGTVKNMVMTEDSAVKTLTTDSYTDNQAVSASSQTSGTAYVSFTPTSVTADHAYIGGLHKDNDLTNETWGGTNMSYSWQGAGVTGKGYCVKGNPSTGNSSIIHTVSSGITTSSILKVEYNFSTNTVKWYKDGSELASTTGDNDSALFATFFTKKGGSVATPVGADNILTSIAKTGNTYEDETATLTNIQAGTTLEETESRKIYYGVGSGNFIQRGTSITDTTGFSQPAFNSVYESLNPLTTVAKQRFVDWFKGSLNTNTWVTHNTGTGSGDFVASDYGLRITSTDNGASTIDWSASNPPPTRPFSNTSSVMIVVSKMVEAQYSVQYCQLRTNHYTEAGQQVGFNVQGVTNGNSGDNKIRLITNSGGGNIDTSLSSSVVHDWHVYKLTVGNGTSTLSVDGVTSGTGFASTSSNPNERLHPALVSSITEAPITGGATSYFRYCEVYNT